MARIVLKTARDRNQYVIWGSIVDDIIAGPGDREQAIAYLVTKGGYQPVDAERIVADTDKRGSSDRSPARFGFWADDPLPRGQDDNGRYELPRDRLATYADAIGTGDEAAARTLLIHREHEEDER